LHQSAAGALAIYPSVWHAFAPDRSAGFYAWCIILRRRRNPSYTSFDRIVFFGRRL